MGQIYKVINKENGKIYIGQTVRTMELRKNEHYYSIKRNSSNNHFHNALSKYDKDSFEWKLLLICDDKDLDYYEVELINKYKSSDKSIGYNSDIGGNSNKIISDETKLKMSIKRKELLANGMKTNFMTDNPSHKNGGSFKGKHHKDETKEKLRLLRIGDTSSEETKAKISKATSGENNPMFGRKHSPEAKEKMRQAKLNKT
jgi:group I intron endonuclease